MFCLVNQFKTCLQLRFLISWFFFSQRIFFYATTPWSKMCVIICYWYSALAANSASIFSLSLVCAGCLQSHTQALSVESVWNSCMQIVLRVLYRAIFDSELIKFSLLSVTTCIIVLVHLNHGNNFPHYFLFVLFVKGQALMYECHLVVNLQIARIFPSSRSPH